MSSLVMTPSNRPPGMTPPDGTPGGAASRDGEERFLQAVATEVERRMEVTPPFDPREALAELHARFGQATPVHDPAARRHTRPFVRVAPAHSQWKGWVAGVTLTATALIGIVVVRQRLTHHDAAPPHRYATTTGQQAVITLGDSTRVTLSARSALLVPADFGSNDRTVTLDGEAQFDVTHAQGTPFVVRSGGVNTQVLGTTFLVRHYATDAKVQVAVTAGKISLSGARVRRANVMNPVTLVAKTVALVSDSGITTATITDPSEYTGWLDGRQVFRNTPATEVFDALTRWYGYEFRFADSSLGKRTLTAVLSTRSSREALTTLQLLMSVDLRFDGNVITVMPHHNKSRTPSKKESREQIVNDNHFKEVGR